MYSKKQYAGALFDAVDKKNKKEAAEIAANFVSILRRDNILSKSGSIIDIFEQIYYRKNFIRKVEVVSVKKLDPSVIKNIRNKFKGEVEIIETIEPSIIGGIKMVIDDESVIDATLKSKTDRLFNIK